MRVRKDEAGNVIAVENKTAAPESGLYCARDSKGVPVSEAGRVQDGVKPAPAKPARRTEPTAPAAKQE